MGSGFFPVVMGALTVFFSILVLLEREDKKEGGGEKSKLDALALLPFGALIAMLLLTQVIGMIPAIAVFIFLWMVLYEKSSLLSSILTAVFTSGSLYGIFGMWLQVRLP